jgi:hypothetical protein
MKNDSKIIDPYRLVIMAGAQNEVLCMKFTQTISQVVSSSEKVCGESNFVGGVFCSPSVAQSSGHIPSLCLRQTI